MNPSEVITMDAQKRGLNPKHVLVSVKAVIGQGGFILSQGNTVLLMQKLSSDVFAAHLFTQDPPLSLSKALVTFFRQMQGKGIHRIYGDADNQEIIGLLKQLGQREGVQVLPSDQPKYNWMIEL
jgi:hypothetical protein